MNKQPKIGVAELSGTTQHAPLVAIGHYLRQTDLLRPLMSRVQFPAGAHTERGADGLVDLWLSMLLGCPSVSAINTQLRPDRTLAQSWGRAASFAEQSTVARILDSCQAEQVAQVREGVQVIQRWIGQSYQHNWSQPLTLDIDLTELPTSHKAQGSSKGYFQEKGGAVGNCGAWVLPSMTRV